MTVDELKQIQLSRQHLTSKTDKRAVVRDLCGLQCQFMSNAYHSLLIRCNERISQDDWGDGLVKNWTLRGTVHVFLEEDLPLFKYDDGNYLSNSWPGKTYNGKTWISAERESFFADHIVKCVSSGISTRADLKTACREAGMTDIEESFIFDGWGGLLRPLCERGYIQYKVQEKKAFDVSPKYSPMQADEARKQQMERYLKNIAPATIRDIAYFFGYTQSRVRDILKELPVKQFNIENKEYYYMGELEADYPDIPACIFLAGFDQLMLGYQKKESIYLPQQYLRGVFNLAGIVMPGMLLNGNIVGIWKRRNNKLEVKCFRELSTKEKGIVEEEANNLWAGTKSLVCDFC